MNYYKSLYLLFILISVTTSYSQGIKGKISDQNNEPLPYATIYVRNLETGTSTNLEGYYEIRLTPGKYDLVYQYMGFKSVVKVVEVKYDVVQIDVSLEPQTVVLKDVVIKAGKEDPAYTIMRKAIAKAKYHTLQLDGYEAKVYIKGSGRLMDSPFFLRKTMAKEGIDSTTAFTSESVTELKFTRPNKYEENVISVRTSGEDNNTSPNAYINSSFYEPKIVDAISPLSPRAFSYYQFQYLGTFTDRGHVISKIKVIPRSKGDNVFQGDLFIVEDHWSIYSLDLSTIKYGINIRIKQIYNPIEDKVWMPINHKFDIEGTFLGFEFEYDYLATVSDYQLTINPELATEFEVIDEKVEEELAQKIQQDVSTMKNAEIIEKLNNGKEVTRKDLRKMIREYEKNEDKEMEEDNIIGERTINVDTTAYNSDSTYWDTIRPVPLSEYERRGYRKLDSMAVVERNKKEGDTLKVTKRGGFRIYDILIGNNYKIGDKTHLKIKSPLETLHFNTVEGYNFDYAIVLTKTFDNKDWLSVTPLFRYAFSRKRASGTLNASYKFNNEISDNRTTINITGGRYINQLNSNEPISYLMNDLTTLFLEQNFLKIYEKEFVEINVTKQINDYLRVSIGGEWTDRTMLQNNSTYKLVDRSRVVYTDNVPENVELLSDTSFPDHIASIIIVEIQYEPWLRFRRFNGEKRAVRNSSPTFSVNYTSSINGLGNDVDFSKVDVGVEHRFDIGARGTLNIKGEAGKMLNDDKLYFPDYIHFSGNRTPFVKANPVGEYRLLDYYEYSTSKEYISAFTYYQFRKFFFTRLPFIRKKGIRENVFANYLGTPDSHNYTEVGYSLDYILRVFKIEAAASFQDGQYQDFGVRVGIATSLENLFNFN